MFIRKVKIHNFKCYKDFEITLEEGLNIVVGDNEAGKSTILEAINLALTGIRVQVALYDDRLEITSPGMLIGGFTALTYMKIIEQWGSGIPRLLENCKSVGLREPELLEIGGSFRVNMFRNTELASNNSGEVREKDGINEDVRDKFVISWDIRDKFGENAAKIAGLMCEKPESTLDEIAAAIGVTRRTVKNRLRS